MESRLFRPSALAFLIVFLSLLGGLDRVLYFDLGAVFRNKVILDSQITDGERNAMATSAAQWFERAGLSSARQTLGLPVERTQVIEVSNLSKQVLSDGSGFRWRIDSGLKYKEYLEVTNFPQVEGNCWVIKTAMSNSTLIEQGTLLGFVLVSTQQGESVFKPVRVGIDTAEWAIDFPDLPPRHSKPAFNVPLEKGGLGYLMYLPVDPADQVRAISFVFIFPRHWHIIPDWTIFDISVNNQASGCNAP